MAMAHDSKAFAPSVSCAIKSSESALRGCGTYSRQSAPFPKASSRKCYRMADEVHRWLVYKAAKGFCVLDVKAVGSVSNCAREFEVVEQCRCVTHDVCIQRSSVLDKCMPENHWCCVSTCHQYCLCIFMHSRVLRLKACSFEASSHFERAHVKLMKMYMFIYIHACT